METDYKTFKIHFDDISEIEYNIMKVKCIKIIKGTLNDTISSLNIKFNG